MKLSGPAGRDFEGLDPDWGSLWLSVISIEGVGTVGAAGRRSGRFGRTSLRSGRQRRGGGDRSPVRNQTAAHGRSEPLSASPVRRVLGDPLCLVRSAVPRDRDRAAVVILQMQDSEKLP